MASSGLSDASDGPEVPFTQVLLTVQTLEDELAGARENAKRAISERDAAQNSRGLRMRFRCADQKCRRQSLSLRTKSNIGLLRWVPESVDAAKKAKE